MEYLQILESLRQIAHLSADSRFGNTSGWAFQRAALQQLIRTMERYQTSVGSDPTDRQLLHRAIRYPPNPRPEQRPRWSLVADLLAVGRCSAVRLCREADADPHQPVSSTVQLAVVTHNTEGESE